MKDGTFTADRLLALYGRVAEAEDAIPRLRRFVLDLAVRGKLVEQDPSDEPAAELLKQIAKEKARLVKAGEIKPAKPIPPASDNDLSFLLPSGWASARLADVAVCLDYMREPINGTEREKRVEGKKPEELYPYFGATQQQGWIDDYIFDEELILLGEDGIPFFDAMRSKAYIISGKTWVNNHAHVFRGVLVSNRFFVHYLNVFDYSGRVVGATRAKLNQAQAVDIPVPLPPLAEQQRIVAKVDELMALCDRLEGARAGREAVRDRLTAATFTRLTAPETDAETFPTHARFALQTLPTLTTREGQIKTLRQTILNLAVRGKLVAQDPTDEPAAELHRRLASSFKGLQRATGRGKRSEAAGIIAEPPFDLPKLWSWVPMGDLGQTNIGLTYSPNNVRATGTPVLRSHNVQNGSIVLNDLVRVDVTPKESVMVSKGDMLICARNGSRALVGKAAIIGDMPEPMAFGAFMALFRSPLNPYLHLFLASPVFRQVIDEVNTTTINQITQSNLRSTLVPLPPLAEQHRIVAKVDALMALCDQLEASLTTTTTTRSRLLEALLHEALGGAPGDQAEAAA